MTNFPANKRHSRFPNGIILSIVARIRVLIFLTTLLVVGTIGTFVFLYAKGYRFDNKSFRLSPNGLLVVKSDPTGASVYVNGDLKTATDATISLAPDTYDVVVRKDGYFPWEKRLNIEKEVVTEAGVSLFKSVPSLSAVSLWGALNPVISSDFTKISYVVPPSNSHDEEKTGLWVLDTLNLPIGFPRDPRRITDGDLTQASYEFSPDGRQILLTTRTGVFLLEISSFTPQNQRVNVASRKTQILSTWEQEKTAKLSSKMRGLHPELVDLLTRKSRGVIFSPDDTMILFTASASATLSEGLVKPLPGVSTQKQERNIKPGQTYVYDIKEDRNFLIDQGGDMLQIGNLNILNSQRRLSWFPTSRHLVLSEESTVTIMDYDGTNRQKVYTGSYLSPHAYPFASNQRLLILTNLGAGDSLPNLYSLSIK